MKSKSLPLVLVAISVCSSTSALSAPRWVRLAWTGPTDTSAVILWNDSSAPSGVAEIRLVGGNAFQAPVVVTETGIADFGTVLRAELTGLAPNTAYEYRVQSNNTWTAWKGFRTAPPPGSCTPFHFVAAGDSRGFELPAKTGNYYAMEQWADVAKAMASEQPLFSLHVGDLLYSGNNAEPDKGTRTDEWASELTTLEPLSSVAPFFMALGNHDVGPNSTQGADAYFNLLFDDPANGPGSVDDNFAFVAGNVLVVGLSTYTFSMDNNIAWLAQVLEATKTQADWRLIFFHTPIWSSGLHGSNEYDLTRAAELVPLLDQYGVELVLAGHDHDYERFHPTRGGWGGVPLSVTPLAADGGRRGTPQGTIHYVTGAGGAQLVGAIAFPSIETNSAFRATHIEYLRLDAHGGTLTITTRDCGAASILPTSHSTCSGDLETIVLEKPTVVCSGGEGGAGGAGAGGAGGAGAGAGGAGLSGGSAPTGGSPPTPGPTPMANTPDAESGCGCRHARTSGSIAPAALLLGLALGLRWRKGSRRLTRQS